MKNMFKKIILGAHLSNIESICVSRWCISKSQTIQSDCKWANSQEHTQYYTKAIVHIECAVN